MTTDTPIYTQFKHNAKAAIAHLIKEQKGIAVAALYHPEIGDIDLVWGKTTDDARSKGTGIAKILRWHPEVLRDLQGFISSLHVHQRHGKKIHLTGNAGERAAVQVDYDQRNGHWLLTAYIKGYAATHADTSAADMANGRPDSAIPPSGDEKTLDSLVSNVNTSFEKGRSSLGTRTDTTKFDAKDDTARLNPATGKTVDSANTPVNSADALLHIENAAHEGAFGNNPLPSPSDAQCTAGNYKVGRVEIAGFKIAIEQPRGTYRTGIDAKTGKRWATRLAGHYGYFSGTKGADGDPVDVFIGFYPYSEMAYVINQFINGRFDEHKVMLCYPDEYSARKAYLDSYERGWKGLQNMIPATLEQLRWWLKNGNTSRPLRPEFLPFAGLETMNQKIYWDGNAMPIDASLDKVLYDIRRSVDGALIFDAVSMTDIVEDADGLAAFDALVTPYASLERKMAVLQRVMDRYGQAVKVTAMQISDPFTQRGVANVAVIYELSDGQTVSVFLHNPDVTPRKIAPTDELISWKWLLNKKDITIVVAPEKGQDLDVKEVGKRIMRLVEKNSALFGKANAQRAERMQSIEDIKTEIVGLEAELKTKLHELEVAKVEAEDRAMKSTPSEGVVVTYREALPPTTNAVESPTPEAQEGTDHQDVSDIDVGYINEPVTEAPLSEARPQHDGQQTPDTAVAVLKDGYSKLSPEEIIVTKMNEAMLALIAAKDNGDARSISEAEQLMREAYGSEEATPMLKMSAAELRDLHNAVAGKPFEATVAASAFGGLRPALDLVGAEVPENKIVLAGNEIGDFPDTPEGKKELRVAARAVFESMLGKWVSCPALDGDVEIRKSGMNKTLSLSGDPRKLKLVAALEELIRIGKKLDTKPSYAPEIERSVIAYHYMRSLANLEGTDIAVRFIVKEDEKGKFHWDHSVHDTDATFDSTKENGPNFSDPLLVTTSCGGGTYPSRLASDQLDGTVEEGSADFNGDFIVDENEIGDTFEVETSTDEEDITNTLDSAVGGGHMVFNLFIEGEPPEVVDENDSGDNPGDETTKPAPEIPVIELTSESGGENVNADGGKTGSVDAAYLFANATDEFKEWLSEYLKKPDYSPFVTAREMDQAAKRNGASVDWGVFSGTDQDIDSDGYVGEVKKGGEIVGRIDIGNDGKAMVFVGATGDQRVVFPSGVEAVYSDDDAIEMVDVLFSTQSGDTQPAIATDPQLVADLALLHSVIDGTVADILSPELGEQMAATFERNQDNAEFMELFNRAVNAYTAAMMAATA
ncbi:hypothetical protein F6R98_10485 [Candidatus Methylospira mobilis]|uniref:Uncharacterized protein n=1 Tax=Candidatus Methylospira mobilis TaxID=1808979 RepID=A0A5Q0BHF7_9GAMM|nr:hypothetical protein [Candidatus Methylospira mobilis]QFY42989.1 hypothetical protein F6R98_10485 [Candidatus Methylospira mobilis]